MLEDAPAFTPVTLLTGFLGSGKTTLLRRLLADPARADTAVIINELGEVGIDHLLVERLDDQMVLLKSGCVCCTVRGELATAMRDLHSRRERSAVPPFRRLVIESTGLADPFPVLSTLKADPVLRHHFRSAGVVATVDAVNGMLQLERHTESVRQVATADVIVLTKTDIAEAAATARLVAQLGSLNPSASLLSAAEVSFDPAVLLQAGGSGFRAIDDPPRGDNQASGYQRLRDHRRRAARLDGLRHLADHAAQPAWRTNSAGQGNTGAGRRSAARCSPWGTVSGARTNPSERLAER